jgi:hypothetical protein
MALAFFGVQGKDDGIRVSLDRRELSRLMGRLSLYQKQFVPKAELGALNRTAYRTRTRAKPDIMALTGLKSRQVVGPDGRFWVRMAKPQNRRAKLWFGTRAPTGAKRDQLPHAPFSARMPTGKVDMFVRAPGAARRTAGRPMTSSANLPIVAVKDWPKYKINLTHLRDQIGTIIERTAIEQMRVYFQREFSRLINALTRGSFRR